MRATTILGVLVLATGCGDATGQGDGGATGTTMEASGGDSLGGSVTGGSVTGGPTSGEPTGGGPTGSGPTGSEPTGSEPTGGGPTGGGPTTEVTTEGGTSLATGSTSGESGTGEPASECASACDRTSVHDGDLVIEPGNPTDWLQCVTRVTGNVKIHGDIAAEALAGLADLQEVDGDLTVSSNALLTELSPLACVRTVGGSFELRFVPGVTELSGLAEIDSVFRFNLRETAVASLDTMPALARVSYIDLHDNPELSDLSALAGWKVDNQSLTIRIVGNPKLADLSGFAGLLGQAGANITVAVKLASAPGLTSLKGLEAMTHGDLSIRDLPAIVDLEPLANYVQAGTIVLNEMPLVSSLHGLHNLETVSGQLVLGDCLNGGSNGGGMDGLVDLSGLDGLKVVGGLGIANGVALVGLDGAPMLQAVNYLELVGNPKLKQAAVDELVAQLNMAPAAQCFGDWNKCECFDVMPP